MIRYSITSDADEMLIMPFGELTAASYPELDKALAGWLNLHKISGKATTMRVTMNLKRVRYVSGAGIELIRGLSKIVESAGGVFELKWASHVINRIVDGQGSKNIVAINSNTAHSDSNSCRADEKGELLLFPYEKISGQTFLCNTDKAPA